MQVRLISPLDALTFIVLTQLLSGGRLSRRGSHSVLTLEDVNVSVRLFCDGVLVDYVMTVSSTFFQFVDNSYIINSRRELFNELELKVHN